MDMEGQNAQQNCQQTNWPQCALPVPLENPRHPHLTWCWRRTFLPVMRAETLLSSPSLVTLQSEIHVCGLQLQNVDSRPSKSVACILCMRTELYFWDSVWHTPPLFFLRNNRTWLVRLISQQLSILSRTHSAERSIILEPFNQSRCILKFFFPFLLRFPCIINWCNGNDVTSWVFVPAFYSP